MKNGVLIIITVVCMFLFLSDRSIAECWHNGQEYPTGAVVGSYVCSESGQWVKK